MEPSTRAHVLVQPLAPLEDDSDREVGRQQQHASGLVARLDDQPFAATAS